MGEDNQPTPTPAQEPQQPQPPTTVTPPVEQKPQEPSTPVNVPDKLQGKDASELAKMYVELEKELGNKSTEIGEYRQFEQQMAVVLKAINENEALKAGVANELERLGKKPSLDTGKSSDPGITTADDTRKAVEVSIIREFQDKTGISLLPEAQRQEILNKVGSELVDMFDPNGTKTSDDIIKSVPLDKLPIFLEKAYVLANKDGEIEKATNVGRIQARQNMSGAIGSIPSSGTVSSNKVLTDEERQMARNLGLSEEDYLKNKISGEN